jgi:hypothetical protein
MGRVIPVHLLSVCLACNGTAFTILISQRRWLLCYVQLEFYGNIMGVYRCVCRRNLRVGVASFMNFFPGIWRSVSEWPVKDRSSFRYIAEERKPHPYRNDIGKTRDLHLVTFRAAGSGYWCSRPPPKMGGGGGGGRQGQTKKKFLHKIGKTVSQLRKGLGLVWEVLFAHSTNNYATEKDKTIRNILGSWFSTQFKQPVMSSSHF